MLYKATLIEFTQAFKGRRTWLHADVDESVSHYPGDHDSDAIHVGVFFKQTLFVGIGSLLPDSNHKLVRPGAWRVRGMAIAPEHRGHGAGAVLMQHLLAIAKQNGRSGLWLTGREDSTGFYKKFGFETQGKPVSHVVGKLFFMQMSLSTKTSE